MNVPVFDHDSRSSIAAAEAQAALAGGDTSRAMERYGEAGRLLETKIRSARKQSEKQLIRFLAASQYYHGGRYQEALNLCRKIDQRLLPTEVKHLFPKFLQDVKTRSAPGYKVRVRKELFALYNRGEYATILERLIEHPYAVPQSKLALLRADLCEKIGNLRAAAAFFADAARMNPDDLGIVSTFAALPFTLPSQGKLDEAWDYVQRLVEAFPHPIVEMVASILCSQRAVSVPNHERGPLVEEQYRYFERARLGFNRLTHREHEFQDFREIVKLGFAGMDISLHRVEDLVRAKLICDQAIAFDPQWGEAWERRGSARYPNPDAVDDFRKAIELGDDRYFPYYFLAHHAISTGEFRSALTLIEQALGARTPPGKRVQAQLHSWLAICNDLLDADREVVNAHFLRALEIDPDNEVVQEGYRNFLYSAVKDRHPNPPHWENGELQQTDYEKVILVQRHLAEEITGANSAWSDLQLVA